MRRTVFPLLIATLGLAAAWTFGYWDGSHTGAIQLVSKMQAADKISMQDDKIIEDSIDTGRDQVCNEIRRYKLAMAKDLDENTQICGYADMDSLENSN
jgi:hypothetical protein